MRNSIEDSKKLKISATHFWENTKSNGFAAELAESKVNYFNDGVILKNEDHSECTNNSSTNSAVSKIEILKTEDDIDIIYENIKPEICEKISSGKSKEESYPNPVADTLVWPNFSREHSIERDLEIVRDKDKAESETIFDKLIETRSTVAKKTLSERKQEMLRKFCVTVNNINTEAEWKALEKLVNPIEPTLAAVRQQSVSVNCSSFTVKEFASSNEHIIKQRRKQEHNKKFPFDQAKLRRM
ncbi:hypothetical protein JTB14_011092 [Gonioctena quinquepunctata]|nr:hypothetical protein JTB14_011092 [Gonioctena quinquepunctata]